MSATSKTSTTSQKGSNGKEQTGADVAAAASGVTDQISEQVSGLSHQVQQQLNVQVASQKDKLVDSLETVSLLLRQAGEHADLQHKEMLSQSVDQAARKVSSWTDSLREQDATQLLAETKKLASRQPLLFMGGALALGFAGARFFRSSAQPPETSTTSSTSSPDADDLALGSGQQYGEIESTFGVVPETTTGYETDLSAGTGGYLEDVEGSFTGGSAVDTDSLYGIDDLTGTEKS